MLTILSQLYDYTKLHVNKYGDILSILINKYKTHVNLEYHLALMLSKPFRLKAMEWVGFARYVRQTIDSAILLYYNKYIFIFTHSLSNIKKENLWFKNTSYYCCSCSSVVILNILFSELYKPSTRSLQALAILPSVFFIISEYVNENYCLLCYIHEYQQIDIQVYLYYKKRTTALLVSRGCWCSLLPIAMSSRSDNLLSWFWFKVFSVAIKIKIEN